MSDLPFNTCVERANKAIKNGFTVLQKFTCANCNTRNTLAEPNVFHKSGRCGHCGHVTALFSCGFLATTIPPAELTKLMED